MFSRFLLAITLLTSLASIGFAQDTLWTALISPPSSYDESIALDVAVKTSGEIAVVGFVRQWDFGHWPPWVWDFGEVVLLNSSGQVLQYFIKQNGIIVSVCLKGEDLILLVNTEAYTYEVEKCGRDGTVIWSCEISGVTLRDIISVGSGGILVIGARSIYSPDSSQFDSSRVFIAKIGEDGELLWANTLCNPHVYAYVGGMTVGEISSLGFIVGGSIGNSGEFQNYPYVVMVDTAGDFVWDYIFSTSAVNSPMIHGVAVASDGDIFAVGRDQTCFIAKLRPNGELEWSRHQGVEGSRGIYVCPTNDGGCIILESYPAYRLSCYNRYGSVVWHRAFPWWQGDGIRASTCTVQGNLIFAGTHGGNDDTMFVAKWEAYAPFLFSERQIGEAEVEDFSFSVFPNPFNLATEISYVLSRPQKVSLKVYSILGREVFVITEQQTVGQHRIVFDGVDLSSGIYFCQLDIGGFLQTKKIVLIR